MNKTKQFWTLFRFQTTLNPFIWFMPVAFSGTLWIPLLTHISQIVIDVENEIYILENVILRGEYSK